VYEEWCVVVKIVQEKKLSLGRAGWCALEPVWPGDPLSVRRALAGSGDVVWNDPKSVARDIASIIKVFLHLFAFPHNFDNVTAFLPEERG
jgi:hypothetical protein